MRSRIIGLAVLMAFILGANPETMAKDYKSNHDGYTISKSINNQNLSPTSISDTLNIRRGFKADRYKKEVDYKLEHFGFIGGAFSRLETVYEWGTCCKPSGNPMDGCSAKKVCPKYTREKK